MSKISVSFKINDIYIDVSSVYLSNYAGTIGLIRNDTGESVISAGTALTKIDIGQYEYEYTDPAYNLEYTYWLKWTYNGETHYKERTINGPLSNTDIQVIYTDINTWVRNKTQRTNTTDLTDTELDGFTLESIREIAKRTRVLKAAVSGTMLANNYSMTAPSDIIDNAIDSFYFDEVYLKPITFEEWRTGKFTGYVFYDNNIYVSPTPSKNTSYILNYRKEHPASVGTIYLSDKFLMAVKYLTCKKVHERYEQEDMADKYNDKYESELFKNRPCDIFVCEARRI